MGWSRVSWAAGDDRTSFCRDRFLACDVETAPARVSFAALVCDTTHCMGPDMITCHRRVLCSSTWRPVLGAVALIGLTTFVHNANASTSDRTRPLAISGTPPSSVVATQTYTFTPTTSGSSYRRLAFSIQNKPVWASFSASRGTLSGTPSAADEGSDSNITISVSNGRSTATLPPFSIQVTAPPATANLPPTISGTPATSVVAGVAYTFQPTATDADGDALYFSIQDKPPWASFSIATGLLSGTPATADVGTDANIVISVSDGTQSTSLPAFSIQVASAPSGGSSSGSGSSGGSSSSSSSGGSSSSGTSSSSSGGSSSSGSSSSSGGSSSSPQIVQHWDTSTSPAGSGAPVGNNYRVNIAPTGSGDVVVFGFTGLSGQTPTVTDSANDAIPSAICSADNGPSNGVSYLYAIAPTAGTTWFKVAWSGSGVTAFNFVVTEFNNISSVAAQGHDCEAGLTATSGTVTPAGFTPTSNSAGNLIYNYTALATGNNMPSCNASGYTPASGFERFGGDTTNWLNGNGYGFQSVMETEIQETAAPVVASMKMAGETCSGGNGDPFNSLTVALKIGSAGISYPSGIHVAQVQQLTTDSFGGANLPSSFSIPFSAVGNLRVFVFEANNGPGSWNSANGTVTSSDGCNFTQVTGANSGEFLYYAQGCSPCPNCTITFPLHSGAALANSAGKFYDIINAASSSYVGYSDTNLSCATGSTTNNPSLTPSTVPGLVLVAVGIGNGPASGLTAPSGAVYAVPYFTGISDGEHLAYGDAHGFYNYSTTATQNWTWTVSGPGNTCTALAAEFQ